MYIINFKENILMANKKKPESEHQTRYSVPMYPETIKVLLSRKLNSGMTWDGFISELLRTSNAGK